MKRSILVKGRENLSRCIFTRDRIAEKRVLQEIPFGGGCINDTVVHLATPYMGFGGVGQSGDGELSRQKRV